MPAKLINIIKFLLFISIILQQQLKITCIYSSYQRIRLKMTTKKHQQVYSPLTNTSKDRLIEESKLKKLEAARTQKDNGNYYQAVQFYHKVIFLAEDPDILVQLAQTYEQLLDNSSALLFYRRANQLKNHPNSQIKQKIKQLTKIKGLQLLQLGSCKNILQNTEFQGFIKRYGIFHKKMLKKVQEGTAMSDYLESCLAYLQVNHRELALGQLQNCLLVDEKDVNILVLKAFLSWSMMQIQKGFKQFWQAYLIDKNHQEVILFLQIINPKVQQIYKEAKYDLIQNNIQKSRLKVKKGLEMHPYHTNLLILRAYLHRVKQQYEAALSCLELANKTLQNKTMQQELRSQISLTYNQMGVYLYKQNKCNEAITLFTEGLSFKANDWGLLTNRGDCYRFLNQYIKALEDYLAAYEIEKKNNQLNLRISSIYSIRGVSLFNTKNYELALQQFDQSLRYSPKNEQFLISKAKCLIQMGRKQQGVQFLQYYLKQNQLYNQIKVFLKQNKQPQQKRGVNNRKIIQLSKQKS